MKAVFLSYNQALTDRVNAIFDEQGIRGFTKWALTEGRGSVDGERRELETFASVFGAQDSAVNVVDFPA